MNTTFKSNRTMSMIAAAVLVVVGLGCSIGSRPDMPSTEQQNALVKQTLKDFTKCLESGDFTSLRNDASKEFQSQVPTEKLNSGFKGMSDNKDTFAPILKSADSKTPQFSTPPAIKEEGYDYTIQLAGSFPTDPFKSRFDFKYIWQDSKWKLLAIEVSFNSDKDKSEASR